MTWMSNDYIPMFYVDTISYPSPNFNAYKCSAKNDICLSWLNVYDILIPVHASHS